MNDILLKAKKYSFKSGNDNITGMSLTFFQRSSGELINATMNDVDDSLPSLIPCLCSIEVSYKHNKDGIKCKIDKIDVIESI